jgi:3-hydroxymyristoyl/3-hydroxydecanoyl-(acyl carrier protein) dehydratase
MKTPTVLARHDDGETLHLTLAVSEDLEWFEGHFPGQPVLPGVVQLHWAVDFAREKFGMDGNPDDVQRLKFKSVIIPPVDVDLKLTRTSPTDVRFEFSGADQQYSEGRLRFPGTRQ